MGTIPIVLEEGGRQCSETNFTLAKLLLQGKNWTFQQDGATSHTVKISQNFCKENFQNFCSKDMWPLCSPDLYPMDFSVWRIVQKRACEKKHYSVESLKRDLLKEWEKLPQDMLRAACENAIKRMRTVCDANGGCIE